MKDLNKWFWRIWGVLVVICVFLLVFATGEARVVYQPKNASEGHFDAHIEQILDRLESCESSGRKIINFGDQPNGGHSYYWYQFSADTFYEQATYYGWDLDIDNYQHQRQLAKRMILDGKAHRWSCAKIIGLID